MPRYNQDKELEQLANRIINQNHPNLKLLTIGYLFREEASISGDKVIAGMAVKTSPRDWTIHKKDVIVEIARDVWEEAEPRFQEALMDHELSHVEIVMDENSTPKIDEVTNRIQVRIRPHDIEEFEGVLARHGGYHKALRSFLNTFVQKKEEQKKAKRAGMTSGQSNQKNTTVADPGEPEVSDKDIDLA